MWGRLLLLGLVLLGAFQWWSDRPVRYGPGVVAANQPRQNPLPEQAEFKRDNYQITALAEFELEARVLGREDYRFDAGAALAPVDLALGWGRMSDEAVLEHVSVSQGGRFYFWSVERFPIPRREVETHSANMHLIPANESVAYRLRKIREGEVVALRGYLVSVRGENGFNWRSSLTRDDTGNGACELIWVENLRVIQPYSGGGT